MQAPDSGEANGFRTPDELLLRSMFRSQAHISPSRPAEYLFLVRMDCRLSGSSLTKLIAQCQLPVRSPQVCGPQENLRAVRLQNEAK